MGQELLPLIMFDFQSRGKSRDNVRHGIKYVEKGVLRKMGTIKYKRKAVKIVNYISGTLVHGKGLLLEIWGRITNSELDQLAGRRNKLAGRMQKSCNMNRDKVRKALDREDGFCVASESSTFRR